MIEKIKSSWALIKESIKIFKHYPQFLVPLLLTWVIYAPVIIYLKYWLNWDSLSLPQALFIVFDVIFLFALLFSVSCSILLELIQQLETGQKLSIANAFKVTLKQNLLRLLPLVFVWTVIWFLLAVLQALLSKNDSKDKDSASAENAAKTLAGYEQFSLSRAFFEALQKGVRMIVFLILPAIAWENMGFKQAVKRGLAIFKSNLITFVSGFVLTGVVTTLIFLPPAVLFTLSDDYNVTFPDWVWLVTMLYIAFAWSYSLYLEQMFTAQLYLWHLKWEKEVKKARAEGKPIPSITQIAKPSVLNEVSDLLDKK